ncbi:hypothetical protein Sste5346_000176 [Sporothrix stenoceras]|uniref:Ring finger domain containing protein n=1 Tax=Sporothrix stenoceras TaxID=5173 RepID=A0ABR3ZS92_9PEZI
MDSPAPAMDLEKELTCSICTDLLYQPLTLLDCLHTFCGACLKEWFGWQALAAETSPNPPAAGTPIFTCPSCRDAVRSTKHNATVVTLLDMLITAQPDKRKPDDEKAEMDSKYRPGDNVFPKVHLPKRNAEQQRLDAAERRLIDEVREISRQEAVAAASGGDVNNAAREARRRQRRAALASTNAGSGADSASDEDGRLAVSGSGDRRRRRSSSRNPAAAPASEQLPHIMGHQSSLRSLISGSQDGPGGSSTALDIEREIEAFARQIQEEGILDGLDLDNIDLTNDDELSRRIAEAYQRRQRGRARHETSSRYDGSRHEGGARRDASRQDAARPEGNRHRTSSAVSAMSHHSQVSVSSAPAPSAPSASSQPERTSGRPTLSVSSAVAGRPPSSSSRTSSRHRSQSQSSHRSRSSTSGARPQSAVLADGVTPIPLSVPSTSVSRPPISNSASHHLEVRDDSRRHHQRRRTASEGRSTTLPTAHSDLPSSRPMAHSQTDLPLRPAELQGDAVVVAELPSTPPAAASSSSRPSARSSDARSATFPTPSPSSSSSSLKSNNDSPTTASFQARALAMGLPGPAGTTQPKQHSSWPVTSPGSASDGGQARNKRTTAPSAAGPSGSSSPSSNQRPAAIATVHNPSPPPVASANFALSPVTIDTCELPAISSPQASSPRQQLQQQQLQLQQQQQQQSGHRRQGSTLYPEPDISCARCNRQHIEYDLHYNCSICSMGNWNICLDCYRAGKGCQHWFGFGYSAWHKWEKKAAHWRAENAAAISTTGTTFPQPHMLTANRFLMPRIVPGGAEGRRTLTSEDPQDRLQSGVFCARCRSWANNCYWRCDVCNEGDWGFCNNCVNQGFACTHPLLPLTHQPLPVPANSPPFTQPQSQQPHLLPSPPPRPHASTLFQVPADPSDDPSISSAPRIGSFRALTFTTTCDLCRKAIPPTRARFHCYSCTSTVVPDTHPGDYDVCQECYGALVHQRPSLVASENGPNGWRRCPSGGHRMVVVAFREDGKNGGVPRRVVLEDLVGGFRLETENAAAAAADGIDLESWYVWYQEKKQFERLVSHDVRLSAPSATPSTAITTAAAAAALPTAPNSVPFPPLGGIGRTAVARWAYYPEQNASEGGDVAATDDELLFPRQAEIREIEDVNGEWYHGVYMGRKGLFPSGFVKMLGE